MRVVFPSEAYAECCWKCFESSCRRHC
jgi:hypothetical protein